MADLAAFQRTLGVTFKEPSLLAQALTHSSYANENPGFAPNSNERLEYLGDAVVGLVVGEQLYRDFPGLAEGDMTKLRAYLVKQETLSQVARRIGLGEQLYLGKGEEASGGREKHANLARAFEAVIAAVYLDHGLDTTEALIIRLLLPELRAAINAGVVTDFKSRLQEYVQSQAKSPPVYVLVDMTGPDHDRTFTVEAKSGNEVLGKGTGKSKKHAEAEAARAALESLTGQKFTVEP